MVWVGRHGNHRALGLASFVTVLAAVPLGCGKSSHSGPSPGTGGSGGDGAGRGSEAGSAGAPEAGSGGAMAGRGGSGGSGGSGGGYDGGGNTGEGGDAPGDAGASASGNGGTGNGGNAGSAGSGGNAGSAGSGGDPSAGASGAAGAAGSGGTGPACAECGPLESCWTDGAAARCVAALVPLPTGLAVDATEVTREQYTAWLATEPATTGQSEICVWNESFAPDAKCIIAPSVCQGDGCAEHPQPCIDFCDAAAYCSALGRRLCSEDEWTSACSADGAYPRGRAENLPAGTCNDFTVYAMTTRPVASNDGCQPPASSGFAGVYDMVGNVEEWTDDCFGEGTCVTRGQSFGFGAAASMCNHSTYAERAMFRDNLGFRCCSPQAS